MIGFGAVEAQLVNPANQQMKSAKVSMVKSHHQARQIFRFVTFFGGESGTGLNVAVHQQICKLGIELIQLVLR